MHWFTATLVAFGSATAIASLTAWASWHLLENDNMGEILSLFLFGPLAFLAGLLLTFGGIYRVKWLLVVGSVVYVGVVALISHETYITHHRPQIFALIFEVQDSGQKDPSNFEWAYTGNPERKDVMKGSFLLAREASGTLYQVERLYGEADRRFVLIQKKGESQAQRFEIPLTGKVTGERDWSEWQTGSDGALQFRWRVMKSSPSR
jgi:hypothetical protein